LSAKIIRHHRCINVIFADCNEFVSGYSKQHSVAENDPFLAFSTADLKGRIKTKLPKLLRLMIG
jgi:hypothetical protein